MKRRDLLKLLGFGAAAAAAPAAAIAATSTAPAAAPATPPVPPAPPAAPAAAPPAAPALAAGYWGGGDLEQHELCWMMASVALRRAENDQFSALLALCEEFQEIKHQDPIKYGGSYSSRVGCCWQLRINNLKQQIEAEAANLGLKTTWNTHYAYFTPK